jgi:hypothetical protein
MNSLLLTVKSDSIIDCKTRIFKCDSIIDCKTRILILTEKIAYSIVSANRDALRDVSSRIRDSTYLECVYLQQNKKRRNPSVQNVTK